MRDIAVAANVPMSSVTYYFGTKKGLYLATASCVSFQLEELFNDISLPNPERSYSALEARAAIQEILCRLMDALASSRDLARSLFILREQINPTDAFEIIYEWSSGRLLETLTDYIQIVAGKCARRNARLTAITLFAQAIVVRTTSATYRKLCVNGDEPGEGDLAALKRQIVSNTDAILDSRDAAEANVNPSR